MIFGIFRARRKKRSFGKKPSSDLDHSFNGLWKPRDREEGAFAVMKGGDLAISLSAHTKWSRATLRRSRAFLFFFSLQPDFGSCQGMCSTPSTSCFSTAVLSERRLVPCVLQRSFVNFWVGPKDSFVPRSAGVLWCTTDYRLGLHRYDSILEQSRL